MHLLICDIIWLHFNITLDLFRKSKMEHNNNSDIAHNTKLQNLILILHAVSVYVSTSLKLFTWKPNNGASVASLCIQFIWKIKFSKHVHCLFITLHCFTQITVVTKQKEKRNKNKSLHWNYQVSPDKIEFTYLYSVTNLYYVMYFTLCFVKTF